MMKDVKVKEVKFMKKSKYYYYDYWRKKVENDEELWSGLFEKKAIDKESIIIAPSILNAYKNQSESAFIVYPNVKSVLGFLKYIYLPTAFDGIFNHDSTNYLIGADLDAFFREQKINNPDKVKTIKHMESLYTELNNLWDINQDEILEHLIQWTKKFNENWLDINGISISFTIFRSPNELAKEIIKVYEDDLDIEMLEIDLDVNKEEFLMLASDDLYTNEFMKRKFTDILTNRLSITF